VKEYKYELINLLLEYGADPYLLLSMVSDDGDKDIIDLLKEHIQTLKNKQMLAFAKTQDMIGNMTGEDLELGILENITKHLRQKGSGIKNKRSKKKKR
jgi:hypothetical protein